DTGGFVEVPLDLTENMQLTVGMRADVYQNPRLTLTGLDPRLGWRFRIAHSDAGDTYLKAGAGRFHQPPRLIVQVPGLAALNLGSGLEGAWQTMVGAEVPLAHGIEVNVQGYFNYTNPIIFDLTSNTDPTGFANSSSSQA